MTEEEAKTRWCPFVRAQQFQPVHNVLAANGEPLSDNPAVNRESWNVNCIGSACMAWQQYVTPSNEGFCGLASKP